MIGAIAGRWPPLIRLLHWATAALALAAIPAAYAAQALTETDTDRAEQLIGLHILAGLAILVLTLARLSARLVLRRRPGPPRSRLHRLLAGLRTAAFYTLLLALPLSGILKLTLSGLDVSAFGMTLIPAGDTAPRLARLLNTAHAWMAKGFIALALLHAGAALAGRAAPQVSSRG